MKTIFKNHSAIIVEQVKEMFEVFIDWETANKYEIKDNSSASLGFAAERTNGIFHRIVRNILRSHRPLTIDIWNNEKKHILVGTRAFYFFFSSFIVSDSAEKKIGEIQTRFGILKRKFDLVDGEGKVFARVESFRWRLWTFSIKSETGEDWGVISKKWGGILKEAFTDADKFTIDLSKNNWSVEQKSVLLFSTLCIDLDFFEDNSNSILDIT